MRTLELLAPAKNLECGIAAIDHGADAVYIGARNFGARAAAGNSVDDIRSLCDYAHKFGVMIHVTVNTIIYDEEMDDTLALVDALIDAGIDALLIQDMGLLRRLQEKKAEGRRLPSLHASTQCDTRSAEKVAWLSTLGFDRAVLARELSVDEIKAIHKMCPTMELEVFVHGALCVSYSGVCYASQFCFDRSANRGACAQFCRLKFDLKDSDGKTVERQRHWLSLKDMCQIDNMEALASAGACAFKIEGRLKDVGYVKNVVSAYSQRLDELIAKYPDRYRRASKGKVDYFFTPNLKKTFNRGYTTYFADGRRPDIFSPDTPKALGEFVGHVKEIRRDSFNVAGTATFANGDGLCFLNDEHELEGLRINKAVGNRLYPFKMPKGLKPGVGLYRNNDHAFEKILSGKTAERKLPLDMRYGLTESGFFLSSGENKVETEFAHQTAQKPQCENIVRQLSKLGNTVYVAGRIDVDNEAAGYFIPSSVLADMRRQLIEQLQAPKPTDMERGNKAETQKDGQMKATPLAEGGSLLTKGANSDLYDRFPYLYNVSNVSAVKFYESQGMESVGAAFELQKSKDRNSVQETVAEPVIMQCRHCIRYSLGYCVRRGGRKPQ